VTSVPHDFFEQIKLFLPKYLTPHQQSQLFEELRAFPDNMEYYLRRSEWRETLLQGDGWRGFVVINFGTSERKEVSGLVLSNSCDIDPKNVRALPASILFSPLIRLTRYEALLAESGRDGAQVRSHLDAIRKQRVTSVFCLPPGPGIDECIVLFDDIHSHPLEDFLQRERSCVFTLNQYAFYLLLLKLSIHFSRFQEGVARFD